MGQKANPNSFQNLAKKQNNSVSTQHYTEYATILQEHKIISTNLVAFFEKRRCLVQNCFFILNNDKAFLTVFVSFLVFKKRTKNKKLKQLPSLKALNAQTMSQKIFKVLTQFGYRSSKRLILQNLNKIALKYQKNLFFEEYSHIKRELVTFNKEVFFEAGLFLFCLVKVTKKTSSLISKFIFRFFRMLHRTKKINKFLIFLSKFIELLNKSHFNQNLVKGLKIQIKGRFNGESRSTIKIFKGGSIPLQTISTKINYSLKHVNTSYGIFGIKVWLHE